MPITPLQLMSELTGTLDLYYQNQCSKQGSAQRSYCRASEVGHPCARYLYHGIHDRLLRKPITPGLMRIFELGHMHHDRQEMVLRSAKIKLERMNEAFEIMGRDGRPIISGHVDGFLTFHPDGNTDPAVTQWIPLEIKTMHPAIYDNVHTVEDFNRYVWARKYAGQLLTYIYDAGEEFGLFLLVNKSTGDYKFLSLVLEERLDEVEALLSRAQLVKDALALGEPPARHVDIDLCQRCDFYEVCLPDMKQDPKLIFADDAEVAVQLDRRAELAPGRSEYNKLDDKLKAWAKAMLIDGQEHVSIGNWLVSIKRGKQTRIAFRQLTKVDFVS